MLYCQKCRIGKFGAFILVYSFLLDTLEFFFFHASCYTYLLGFKNNGRPVWTRAGILDHLSTAKMSNSFFLAHLKKAKILNPKKPSLRPDSSLIVFPSNICLMTVTS